jgi:hypothetical protein
MHFLSPLHILFNISFQLINFSENFHKVLIRGRPQKKCLQTLTKYIYSQSKYYPPQQLPILLREIIIIITSERPLPTRNNIIVAQFIRNMISQVHTITLSDNIRRAIFPASKILIVVKITTFTVVSMRTACVVSWHGQSCRGCTL